MKLIPPFFSDTLVITCFILIFSLAACSDNSSDGDIDDMSGITLLSATLTGGGESDPDGSGTVTIMINTEENEVCFEFQLSNIEDPYSAHIHRNESGQIAVNFDLAENGLAGCLTVVADEEIDALEEVVATPQNFYVNVHNNEYQDGAISGELMK